MSNRRTLWAIPIAALLGLCLASASYALPTFYLLNTENTSQPFRGQIDQVDVTGPATASRTAGIADVDPSPFSNILDWKGFATDNNYFYFLNTNGGGAFPGRIDRTNLDGTGRTQVADLDPSVFTDIEEFQGFAADNQYFYLLNTEAPDTGGNDGQIWRVNKDGTNPLQILDVEPAPFSNINDWKGFATDGQSFYFLNTNGGAAFLGRIDMTTMSGTARMQVVDIDPSLYGVVEHWRGFAAYVIIPEPATFIIWSLGLLGLIGCRRRRTK
jgi:hypothetical protein